MKVQFAGSSLLVLFGSLTCALVDASADTHPQLRHRNLQECPPVSSLGYFCPQDTDATVLCNGNCEYDNLCLAATAGIFTSFCEKVDPEACPENVLFPCSGNYKPVICKGGCQYDNICVAVGAGGMSCEAVQEEVCPIPDERPCNLNIDPVKCGPNDCTYDNPCAAEAAGFSPADECKSAFDIPEPEPGTCPVTGPAVSCINEPDPVICGGDDCEYPNLCLAVGAGFKEGDCVSHCPIGNRGFVACEPILDPVLCGGLCVYDNLCSAQAGPGFSEEDCESISSECPARDPDRVCIAVFEPVDCNGCIYENGCIAGGAGYSEGDCVLVKEPPIVVNPDEALACPASDPDLICIALFEPVECKGCIYENGCLAGGAGYSEGDCVLLEEPSIIVDPNGISPTLPAVIPDELFACPASDPDLICITLFEPVECNGCKYSNGCLAGGAGYSEGDCVLIEEPPVELNPNEGCKKTDPDVVCITLFAPVVCNGCTYSNGCLAGGAGYSETDCDPAP